MQLVQVKVSSFRCFKDATAVVLDNLVVLIGKNDSGKSSLLLEDPEKSYHAPRRVTDHDSFRAGT